VGRLVVVGEDQVGNVLEHLTGLTLWVSSEIKVDTFQLLKSVFVEQVGDVEAAAGKHLNRQDLQLDALVDHLFDSLELDVQVKITGPDLPDSGKMQQIICLRNTLLFTGTFQNLQPLKEYLHN
jgi:hypothetical protein